MKLTDLIKITTGQVKVYERRDECHQAFCEWETLGDSYGIIAVEDCEKYPNCEDCNAHEIIHNEKNYIYEGDADCYPLKMQERKVKEVNLEWEEHRGRYNKIERTYYIGIEVSHEA